MILGGLAIAAFTAGWFQIHREGEHTMIRIDRSEIREDASRVIDRGRDFLERRQMEQQARRDAEFGGPEGYPRDDAMIGRSDDPYRSATAVADDAGGRYARPTTYGYGRPTGYRGETGSTAAGPAYRDRGDAGGPDYRGADPYAVPRSDGRQATEFAPGGYPARDEVGYREDLRYNAPRR